MGTYKYTKNICLFLLICCCATSALRTQINLNDDNEAPKTTSTTFYLTTGSTDENNRIMSNDMSSSFKNDIKSTCATNRDSLYNRLNTQGINYARIEIFTIEESLNRDSSDLIEINDSSLQGLIRDKYRDLAKYLKFKTCNIYAFADAFYIVPKTTDGVTAERNDLLKDYLHLDGKYRDVCDALKIDSVIKVNEVENQYFLNDKRDKIDYENHYFETSSSASSPYTIQSAHLDIDTLKICVPRDVDISVVSFQGNLNTDDGSNNQSLDQYGMIVKVPAKTDLLNSWVHDHYEKKHRNLEWDLVPASEKMSAEYLINLLDKDISTNSQNSYVYGYNQYYEIDKIIPPPKGLASIAKFTYSSASLSSRDEKMQNIYLDMEIPDFAFLPLQLETITNECFINYTNVNVVDVSIVGKTQIGQTSCKSNFIKEVSEDDYTITLDCPESTMTFDSIHKDLIPTMQMGEANILTSDQDALDNLAKLGITETETIIYNPVIEMNFKDYYIYRVSGSIHFDEDPADWSSIKAEFSNLDGYVLSYVRFFFPSSSSNKLYQEFFNCYDGDSGFRSLELTDFQLISVNRDINMDKLEALRHTSIIAYASSGVILKDGVTVFLNAQFITDCIDYTFCRIIKKWEIPSSFNMTGLYMKENTRIEGEMKNVKVTNDFNFKNNTLSIKVGKNGEANYSYLKLKGDMIVAVDPNTDVLFNGLWRFGNENSSPIVVTGTKYSAYEDVFENPIVDLLQNEISIYLYNDQERYNFNYTALGIIGDNCYSRNDLIDYSNISADNYDSSIYPYTSSPEYMDDEGNIDIIKDSCRTGETMFYITDELKKNYYTSLYNFTSINDFMNVVFTVRGGENVEPLTNRIDVTSGLEHTYSYENSKNNDPMPFVGNMTFLNVTGLGKILAYTHDKYIDLTITLPSFTVGGGNLQFLTYADFLKYYDVDKRKCKKEKRFDKHIDCDDFTDDNTLSTTISTDNLGGSFLNLDSNALLFEILFRYRSDLVGRKFIVPITGRPYKGEFEANIQVDVEFVPNLEKETSSIVKIVMSQNDNYNRLKDRVNGDIQTWIKSIILADNSISIRTSDLIVEKEAYENELNSLSCEVEEICDDYPKITCEQYSIEANCIETKDVCRIMTQQCTEEESVCARQAEDGSCYESISVCKQWENKCVDYTTVCIDFEEQNIPDQCIKVELQCTKILKADNACLNTINYYSTLLQQTNDKIDLANEWAVLMKELRASSVCSIKVSNKDDRSKYSSCANKQVALNPYDEDVPILDIVKLKNVTSLMNLREIDSSDAIIFDAEIQLYGDWATHETIDHMISSSEASSDEYKGDDYDVGYKSNLVLNHTIDFLSIDSSASKIADRLKRTICKEFGITNEKSSRIQIILREFSSLNAYPQICQPYTELKSPYLKSQDTEGIPQENIYGSLTDEGSDVNYGRSGMTTSKTKTGIQSITYFYDADPKVVHETEVSHSYESQTNIGDDDLLGLDQRLIASVEDKENLSTLTDKELEELDKKEKEDEKKEEDQQYEDAKQIKKDQENQDKINKENTEKLTDNINQSNDQRIDDLQEQKSNENQPTATFESNTMTKESEQPEIVAQQNASFEPTQEAAIKSEEDIETKDENVDTQQSGQSEPQIEEQIEQTPESSELSTEENITLSEDDFSQVNQSDQIEEANPQVEEIIPTEETEYEPIQTEELEPTQTEISEPIQDVESLPIQIDESEPIEIEEVEISEEENINPPKELEQTQEEVLPTSVEASQAEKESEPEQAEEIEPAQTEELESIQADESENNQIEEVELTEIKDYEQAPIEEPQSISADESEPTLAEESEPTLSEESEPALAEESEPVQSEVAESVQSIDTGLPQPEESDLVEDQNKEESKEISQPNEEPLYQTEEILPEELMSNEQIEIEPEVPTEQIENEELSQTSDISEPQPSQTESEDIIVPMNESQSSEIESSPIEQSLTSESETKTAPETEASPEIEESPEIESPTEAEVITESEPAPTSVESTSYTPQSAPESSNIDFESTEQENEENTEELHNNIDDLRDSVLEDDEINQLTQDNHESIDELRDSKVSDNGNEEVIQVSY